MLHWTSSRPDLNRRPFRHGTLYHLSYPTTQYKFQSVPSNPDGHPLGRGRLLFTNLLSVKSEASSTKSLSGDFKSAAIKVGPRVCFPNGYTPYSYISDTPTHSSFHLSRACCFCRSGETRTLTGLTHQFLVPL